LAVGKIAVGKKKKGTPMKYARTSHFTGQARNNKHIATNISGDYLATKISVTLNIEP
jgi:hypothetical protein